ncbi:MAG: ABC transporter permease [Anaerorhabdus sp.]
MKNFNVYKSLVRIEFRALLREPITLFFMIILPIIFTIVFGGAFGKEVTKYGPEILGIDTVIPINVVFLIANVGLMGIPITVIELKEQGVLKRYASYPMTFVQYFLAMMTAFTILSIVSVLVFCTISFLFYGASFHMSFMTTLIFIVLFLSALIIFDSIGFIIALLISNARVANMFCSGVFLAMIFTSGVVMPVESMPEIVQKMVLISPMYHFTQLFTFVWVDLFSMSNLMGHIVFVSVATVLFLFFLVRVRLRWD